MNELKILRVTKVTETVEVANQTIKLVEVVPKNQQIKGLPKPNNYITNYSAAEARNKSNAFLLSYFHVESIHNWAALTQLNVDVDLLVNECVYVDPFVTGFKYYTTIPLVLLTNDPSPYREKLQGKHWFQEYMADTEWIVQNHFSYDEPCTAIDGVSRAHLGHGYMSTNYEKFISGMPTLQPATLRLSNDDLVVCVTWGWNSELPAIVS